MRLVDQRRVQWQNRAQFFAIAARLTRRVLLNHARDRQAQKRGGDATRVTLIEGDAATRAARGRSIDLDRALQRLARARRRPGAGGRAALLRRPDDRGDRGGARLARRRR